MLMINHRSFGAYDVETIVVDDASSFTIACSPQRYVLPSNGGIRWLSYGSLVKQKEEAIMLAYAMDLKHRLYQTGFSGGKIVVNSSANPDQALHVFDAIGAALNRHQGAIYTGCDINVGSTHMSYLRRSTPWILDAMDSPQVNTSTATGFGVWCAIQAVLRHSSVAPHGQAKIAIHGLGKVGQEVARQALAHDCEVVGFDRSPAATISSQVRLLDEQTFWAQNSDILCLASLSGVLDEATVSRLNTRWIVSSANGPFVSQQALKQALAAGIDYMPDYVSNAGAVICDSIERFFPAVFTSMRQAEANDYVGMLIGAKSAELVRRAQMLGCNVPSLLNLLH